jgi:AmiR/NasT family two-component response regulator
MQREGLSEEDAFARLRKASQISGRPLKVVAEALVATLGEDASGPARPARPPG